MDALIVLRHVKVENANAIAGLTWGFPAVSSFLGFVHALSRNLSPKVGFEMAGCGVISHRRQVLAHKPRGWGDYVFSLTRNPLTKEEESASFVEEGRMHMEVSLVIPCSGEFDDHIDPASLKQQILRQALSMRLAGGTITGIGDVDLIEPPETGEEMKAFERKQIRKLLPGFALVLRSDALAEHVKRISESSADAEPVDAWLDFAALKYQAEKPAGDVPEKEQPVEWHYVPKPAGGWLVPIAIGYRGISKLYEPGNVSRARDGETPFCFVEAVYSVGEWISPHRVGNLRQLIWRYDADPDTGWYLFNNEYKPVFQ